MQINEDIYGRLLRSFNDIHEFGGFNDLILRIYFDELEIRMQIEQAAYKCLLESATPTTFSIPRCRRVDSESIKIVRFTSGKEAFCMRQLAIAGRALPEIILNSVRKEVDNQLMNPATEWACWLTYLCGSNLISSGFFEQNDLLITRPLELSILAINLLQRVCEKTGSQETSQPQIGNQCRCMSIESSSTISTNSLSEFVFAVKASAIRRRDAFYAQKYDELMAMSEVGPT